MPWRIIATGLVGLAALVSGCEAGTDSNEQGVRLVATTSILGDIASKVVGGEGTVEVLVPIGGDTHDFQLSAQEAARLSGADLVIAAGLGLEQGLGDLLASAAPEGTRLIELAPMLDPISFLDGSGGDPHFWMDPERVGRASALVADGLAEMLPDGAWARRAEAYTAEMAAVDEEVRAMLEPIPAESRTIVTNHLAFGYFADRYGFEVVGVVIPGGSALAQPSSSELADLVGVMRREEMRVIFAETSRPTTLADAVAAELGNEVTVVELFTESLGPAGSGADTLAEMLVTNAERIASALG